MSDDEEWKSSFVQGDDAALTAAIKAREAECDPLLRRGPSADPVKALALSLADPPYATRTAAVKDAATELVCKCMASASDIDAAIGTLSLEQCDVLMKYIYRGRAALRRPASPAPAPPAAARPHRALRRRRAGSASARRSSPTTSLLKWHPAVMKKAGQASIMRTISEVQRNLERGMGIRDLSLKTQDKARSRAQFLRAAGERSATSRVASARHHPPAAAAREALNSIWL